MSELAQESIGTNDFEKWLNERSNWLQTAAKQLIENKRLQMRSNSLSWFDSANWKQLNKMTLGS
jgi:hypothetical protein